MDRRTKRTIIGLIGVSAVIYGLQLLIFHDPNTTVFYIFQDMAFMPFTIAIATIVVGEVMSAREKKERLEKTRMLTSSFFTELGTALLQELLQTAEYDDAVSGILTDHQAEDERSLERLQKMILDSEIRIRLTEEIYTGVREMILERQTMLLVISSNPLLLEHESFTDMLWGIFHLIDEFRLRGGYGELTPSDMIHFESDFSDVLKLLLVNWVSNVQYMKHTYPNFFGTARSRLERKERA